MAEPRICEVEGCGKDTSKSTGGLCGAHRFRLLRHGDPLGGGPPRNSSGHPKAGRGEPMRWAVSIVASDHAEECVIWPFSRFPNGYGQLNVRDQTSGKIVPTIASRVVCEMAFGPPPTVDHECAHSCGKGHLGCVNPAHLRWSTCKENRLDKKLHGTQTRGDTHPVSKLTESNVKEIRATPYKHGLYAEFARRYGVDINTVRLAAKGVNWAWLE